MYVETGYVRVLVPGVCRDWLCPGYIRVLVPGVCRDWPCPCVSTWCMSRLAMSVCEYLVYVETGYVLAMSVC